MTDFNKINQFKQVCKDLTDDKKSKGKTAIMLSESELVLCIDKCFDPSEIDLLESKDFRKSYYDRKQEWNDVGVFFGSDCFKKAIGIIHSTAKPLNKYSRHAVLPEEQQPSNDQITKKINKQNALEKATYRDVYNSRSKCLNYLKYNNPYTIQKDFDTGAYIVTGYDNDLHSDKALLLTYPDVQDRLSSVLKRRLLQNDIDFPIQTKKEIQDIIKDYLYSLDTSSYFARVFMSNPPIMAEPYKSITDFIQWDTSTLSVKELNKYLDYVYLSQYVNANMYLYHDRISKPSVFPLLVNTEQGTGKTSFIHDLFSVFYPANMILQVSDTPHEKEIVENTALPDHEHGIQGRSSILIDELTIDKKKNSKDYNYLKELLTKNFITSRSAFAKQPRTIPNRFYFFTSNIDNQVPPGERRFMIIPKFKYKDVGDRTRAMYTIYTRALDVIAKFQALPVDEQIIYFNNQESEIQAMATETSKKNNYIVNLKEEYQDQIDNFFVETSSYSGCIEPRELYQHFPKIGELSKKERIEVLKLCGYDYKLTGSHREPRIKGFIPTQETKKRLYQG